VAALPKNEHGNLGHSAVRYALHRVFVLRHGWVIKGLSNAGDAWNASSPSGVLTDHVPAYLVGLFEQRLAGRGFGLHDTSVLAATIEHLIHNEAVGRLGAAFNIFNLPFTGTLSEADVSLILDTYMMSFILGEDLENMTVAVAKDFNQGMPDIFLAWGATQEFVSKVRASVTAGKPVSDFGTLAKVVEAVGEQFGSFQDFECRQLKDKLMSVEFRGTGRVKLSDFYKPALGGVDGAWQFQESTGYLRQLGTLDETDSSQPSVMIANYLNSQTNCIAASGFYSVCCKDECENLMGSLEEKIGASEAAPSVIGKMVSSMRSSTVTSSHQISGSLESRLNDIARAHGGMVPLHGRLFAQFMHYVFPRECSYPHVSGTISSVTADQWQDQSGDESLASEDEMRQYLSVASNVTVQGDLALEELVPWSTEEELFVVRAMDPAPRLWGASSAPGCLRSLTLLSIAGSISFGLIRGLKVTSVLDTATPLKYTI